MKKFLLIVLLSVFIFGNNTTLTNRQLQEKIASGELTIAWDKNITKVKTINTIAKLEAKIWLIEDNTKNMLKVMDSSIKILWNRVNRLESRGCECEVKCKSKRAKEMIEDIQDLIEDVESRVDDLETRSI